MKYNIEAIVDFLENEQTETTWGGFASMLFDKFDDECGSLVEQLSFLTQRETLSVNDSCKFRRAVELLNEVL